MLNQNMAAPTDQIRPARQHRTPSSLVDGLVSYAKLYKALLNLIEKDYGRKNDHLLPKPVLLKTPESAQHLRWEDITMPWLRQQV